jgi:Zn-dependent M16 (insulinase) family peptidase
MEKNASDLLVKDTITDFLYGKEDASQFENALDIFSYLDDIILFSKEKWSLVLKSLFLDKPHVIIIGKPSAALASKLELDEAERLLTQKKSLGPEKLNDLKRQLEEAEKLNNRPIPNGVLGSNALIKINFQSQKWKTLDYFL